METNKHNQPRIYPTYPPIPHDRDERMAQDWSDVALTPPTTIYRQAITDDTYDWSGKRESPASPPPRFNEGAGGVIVWAWRGIICMALIIPTGLVALLFTIAFDDSFYSWGVWPILVPLLVVVTLGLTCSLTSLLHFHRSNQPILVASLSLLGIAIGTAVLLYLWQSNITAHTCGDLFWYICNRV